MRPAGHHAETGDPGPALEETIMAKRTSSGQPQTETVHTRERLDTPTDLTADATRDICAGVNGLVVM